MKIFHSILYILLIQICECQLLTSSWSSRAYYSETSSDFFLVFFFQSDRPTQYQETHSTVNEEEKGDGLAAKSEEKRMFSQARDGHIYIFFTKNEKSKDYCKADLKQRVLFFTTIFRLAIPAFFRFTDVAGNRLLFK